MTTSQASPQTHAGWYPDPSGGANQRYFDGFGWTEHYAAPAVAAAPSVTRPAPSAWWAAPVLAVLALIGAAGPWVSAGIGDTATGTANGLDGDGVITVIFVLGSIGLLTLWRATPHTWSAVTAAVLGAIAGLLPLIYVIEPSTGADGILADQVDWSTGWGAYVALLACLALTALSVVMATATKRRRV